MGVAGKIAAHRVQLTAGKSWVRLVCTGDGWVGGGVAVRWGRGGRGWSGCGWRWVGDGGEVPVRLGGVVEVGWDELDAYKGVG